MVKQPCATPYGIQTHPDHRTDPASDMSLHVPIDYPPWLVLNLSTSKDTAALQLTNQYATERSFHDVSDKPASNGNDEERWVVYVLTPRIFVGSPVPVIRFHRM